jgi:hypothetical protein
MPKVLLRSEQSGGAVSVIDNVVPAGFPGPPLHVHDFDEAFYVVRANRSRADARYVLVCTPAGFERYFGRMAAEQAGVDPPEWAMQDWPKVIRVGPRIGE